MRRRSELLRAAWGLRVGLALALGCAEMPALAGGVAWREVAPLPAPRFFHSAVVVGERVFVLGGRVKIGERARLGIGERALLGYEPDRDRWVPGPRLEVGVMVTRLPRVFYQNGKRHEEPGELISGGGVDFGFPLAGALPGGPIIWLGEPTPAVFHPARGEHGAWDAPATIYDGKERRWVSSVPEMIRRTGTAAVGPDGRIYALGGIGYPLVQRDRPVPPKPLYSLFASMDAYDPETHTWEKRAPMRRARQLFAASFAPDGKLYVFGGYGHVGSVRQAEGESEASYRARVREMKRLGREALREVEVYDPATDRWEARAPMPWPRHGMDAAVGADGRIYVVGGAVSYSRPIPTREVQVYDPVRDRWAKGPSMEHTRFQHAVAADAAGRLYAIGGFERGLFDNEPTASVELLDTRLLPHPAPAARP